MRDVYALGCVVQSRAAVCSWKWVNVGKGGLIMHTRVCLRMPLQQGGVQPRRAAALQSPWGKRSVCERVHENERDSRVQRSPFLPVIAVCNISPVSSPRGMGSPCVYAYVTFCVRRVGEWYNKAVAHVIFNSLSPWKPAHMLGAMHPAECVCVCLWRCSSSSCFIWRKHTHVAHACRSVCARVSV